MAYSVLRGTALPANCDEKIWADDLRLEWQAFRLAAMCEAVKVRQSDMPGYLSIASVLEWAGKLVSNFFKPLAENDLADMITPAYASGANVKKKKQAKEEDHLDSLRQKLNKDLAENDSGNKELQELVNKDDPADLLEAVLRIYPEREI